ncbi:uncharacterized protein LOC130446850 isoform X3 [Diorhabda sublineata]|uniref:uncharacterized protein LOC130446850 isoform X3 n=1 Tax=Diorhabda sublineata TaxID=1163346 RepID=UPI0024E055C7|nr:uncharacterized protein LOC130446850 isoform X3 [Diorhabda sublineata]
MNSNFETLNLTLKKPTINHKSKIRLFEIQPKHQSGFPFRDVATKDLPNDKKFQAHVNTFMYSFTSIVSNLDNEEILLAILYKIGASHATRSVDRQTLIDVRQAFLDTFECMRRYELDAWIKLFDVLINEISHAIDEKLKEISE